MRAKSPLIFVALGLVLCTGFAGETRAATYGCFKVTSGSLNIRDRPYSTAKVIGMASKGDILEKRKLFCTPRGFWCATARCCSRVAHMASSRWRRCGSRSWRR